MSKRQFIKAMSAATGGLSLKSSVIGQAVSGLAEQVVVPRARCGNCWDIILTGTAGIFEQFGGGNKPGQVEHLGRLCASFACYRRNTVVRGCNVYFKFCELGCVFRKTLIARHFPRGRSCLLLMRSLIAPTLNSVGVTSRFLPAIQCFAGVRQYSSG